MLNMALMGCGRISKRHSEVLGYGKVKGARLSAVCDVDILKAKSLAEQFNIPYYDNISDLINNEPIDVVSVLTESGNHANNVIEVASLGKHVIVEKPMALTLSDANQMIEACRKQGVKLFVVKQNRYNRPVVKLKEAVKQGRLGRVILGTTRVRWCRKQDYYDQANWRGSWKMDGGVIANQASHHIDMLQWIMGDVESVFAKSLRALANIEAEDTLVATLKYKNGALGIIEATTATRPNDLEGSISILGEKGSVVIGGYSVNNIQTWDFEEPKISDEDVIGNWSENPPNVYGFGHQEYYESVVNCLRSGTDHPLNGIEGRKSLKLISAIYESVETGREIFLDRNNGSYRLGNS